MVDKGMMKFYYGFIFIMLSFRIQRIDILPDVIGYILFAIGFKELEEHSSYFAKAFKYNLPMLLLSVLSIYQVPAQEPGINFGPFGKFGILITAACFTLNLLIVYNLFMGIRDMAESRENIDIADRATEIWKHYRLFQIASLLVFAVIFIPALAIAFVFVLFVLSIALLIAILGFIKKSKEALKVNDA